MKPFRYLRDPLMVVAVALYVLNRWWWKPHLTAGFMRNQFNDLLLIPAALPVMLWIHRRLGWRRHDAPPTPGEIGLHLVVWTVIAEVIAPQVLRRATGDWRDAVAYLAGAIGAAWWWHGGVPDPWLPVHRDEL